MSQANISQPRRHQRFRWLSFTAGAVFGFLCAWFSGWFARSTPGPPHPAPSAASVATTPVPGTIARIPETKSAGATAGAAPPIPRMSELSPRALEKLALSCLATDLTVDPVLAELASLNPSQLAAIQSLILQHQKQWSEREAARCIALQDRDIPKVIIPPLPNAAAAAETALKNSMASVVGDDRLPLVWSALSHGLRQATGDFGRIPRVLSFEKNPQDDSGETIRVRVGVFDWDQDELISVTDWSKLTSMHPTRMESFAFREVPPQFAPFVDKKP